MSTLPACKESPGDWNASPFHRQKLRLRQVPGSGDGACYGPLFLHTQQISVSVQRLLISCSADTYCNIPPSSTPMFLFCPVHAPQFPWDEWRRGYGEKWSCLRQQPNELVGDGRRSWTGTLEAQVTLLWHAGLHVLMLLPQELSSRDFHK